MKQLEDAILYRNPTIASYRAHWDALSSNARRFWWWASLILCGLMLAGGLIFLLS